VSLFPTQSYGDGGYKTGGNACHDLGYEYADGTWIMDVLSPDHVYYNRWQIKLGSSAYFLRVMFEIFDGNSLYVRQRRQAATKDEDLIADILSLDGESCGALPRAFYTQSC
jgi:hypothetical protein